VNIGTSGAEIGGAFGGEKDTARPRVRKRCIEGLHAPADGNDQWSRELPWPRESISRYSSREAPGLRLGYL
jgi:hypothetical protein